MQCRLPYDACRSDGTPKRFLMRLYLLLLALNMLLSVVFYVLAYYMATNIDRVVDKEWGTPRFQVRHIY